MRWGFRSKLITVSVVVVALAVAVLAIVLERDVRQRLLREEVAQLENYSKWLAFVVSPTLDQETAVFGDPASGHAELRVLSQIDTFAALMACRVSLIASDGTVVVDSAFSRDTLSDLDNHRNRPEFVAAQQNGTATAVRFSTTLQETQMYAATVVLTRAWRGMVRVSRSMAGVEQSLTRVRMRIVVGALGAAAVAVFMSWFATSLLRRELRGLLETARAIAEGKEGTRANVAAPAEIGHIAGSLNQLSDALAATVSELAEHRDRFQAVLESMTDAVLVCDGTQRIVLSNSAARALLGPDGGVEGSTLLEAIRSEALSRLVSDARILTVASGEVRFRANKKNTCVKVSAQYQRRWDNTVIVMHDVTELRHLERVRKEFLANVSHELRTPAATISIGAEMLAADEGMERDRTRKLAQSIHRNAQRLGRIIGDMLELARIEAGIESFQRFDVLFAPVLEACLEPFADRIEKLGQKVVVAVPDDLRVRANDRALERVLTNLIDNATKFTPAGGELGVVANVVGNMVYIEVWDHGPGIFAEDQARVFERFYRVDPSRNRDSGGTGLGLALVRHLVESMGGAVGVVPNNPTGCRFWLTLSVGQGDPPSHDESNTPSSVT